MTPAVWSRFRCKECEHVWEEEGDVILSHCPSCNTSTGDMSEEPEPISPEIETLTDGSYSGQR